MNNTYVLVQHVLAGRDLKAQIAALQTQLDFHTDRIAALSPEGVTGQQTVTDGTDTVTYTLREKNAYPEAAARAVLKPGQVARCLTSKWDSKKFAALYPDVRESVKVNDGVTVVL